VLVTRPRPQAERFAERLGARFGAGLDVIIAPLLRMVPLPPLPAFRPGEAVAFTSENGVAAFAALGGQAQGRVAWCVGGRTAEAAMQAGFATRIGPGDAAGLARAIAVAGPAGLVHLHGRHVSGDLVGTLAEAGIAARGAAIYDQEAQPLSATARARLADAGEVVVPVFSARTAQLLVPELAAARARLWLAPISAAVAACLPVPPAGAVEVAATPDAEGVLDALAALTRHGRLLETTPRSG
jgi:uroporphyrinogen-III synthase